MFKPIAQEIKTEVISRIKNNGESVSKLANEYQISVKTIYGWLRKQSEKGVSVLELSRLRRENKLLLEIVGRLTLDKNLKKS